MIISNDSPLRRLPALPRKQTLYFDGIRYSIDMADTAYSRLAVNLFNLSVKSDQAHKEGDDRPYFVSVMQDAWSMIDSVHRLRGLLQQTPGVKQKVPPLEIFYRNTANLEDLRNGVQHLNQHINELVSQAVPVWGSLAWVARRNLDKPQELYLGALIAGTMFKDVGSQIINPIGKVINHPIDHITLTAFGSSVNLSAVWAQVQRMTKSLEDAVEQIPAESSAGHPGSDLHVGLVTRPADEPQTEEEDT